MIYKALVLCAAIGLASAATAGDFRAWAKQHGKVYTQHEQARRFAIYKENAAVAERLNLEGHGAKFAATKFADLTNAEFAALYTTQVLDANHAPVAVVPDASNAELDYKDHLPAIKNQASCGSCWAFSAVANAEGQTYMANGGTVVALSEQQLVSCDKGLNQGCNGGNMYFASLYAVKNGLASEEAYPYKSGSGTVPACKAFEAVAQFSSAKSLGAVSSDATLMKYLETYGPLSIAIEADKSVFQLYTEGVLDSTACGTATNHGVTLVGYGTDGATGKNYWTVRNSWGPDWGEAGYIRMARGKDMCGMNSQISTIIA